MLELDGERVGDSSSLIAALERRYPEPALLPPDPAERRRALELEDWFDEQLGPPIRQFGWHEMTRDKPALAAFARHNTPPGTPAALQSAMVAGFVSARYGAGSAKAAEGSRERVLAALDRLEQELGDEDYLVGGRFSVADLTAASLFYPLVRPPEGPRALPVPAGGFERLRASVRERRGYRWVEEMYRRHRRAPGREREAAATSAR